jgi:hypothetical protein
MSVKVWSAKSYDPHTSRHDRALISADTIEGACQAFIRNRQSIDSLAIMLWGTVGEDGSFVPASDNEEPDL